MTWVEKLPTEVYQRLGNCRNRKSDVEILVNVKWATMVEAGKQKQGFTKEDALIDVLDLLDSNGQFIDLSKEEYDELKREII